jgi:hypothetical protein
MRRPKLGAAALLLAIGSALGGSYGASILVQPGDDDQFAPRRDRVDPVEDRGR